MPTAIAKGRFQICGRATAILLNNTMSHKKTVVFLLTSLSFACSGRNKSTVELICLRDVPEAKCVFEKCTNSQYFSTHFLDTYPSGYASFDVNGTWGAYEITLQCDAYFDGDIKKINSCKNWVVYARKIKQRRYHNGPKFPPIITYDRDAQYKFTSGKDLQAFFSSTDPGILPPAD